MTSVLTGAPNNGIHGEKSNNDEKRDKKKVWTKGIAQRKERHWLPLQGI